LLLLVAFFRDSALKVIPALLDDFKINVKKTIVAGKLFDWVGASPFRSPFAFGNLILRKKDEVLVNIMLPQISKQKF